MINKSGQDDQQETKEKTTDPVPTANPASGTPTAEAAPTVRQSISGKPTAEASPTARQSSSGKPTAEATPSACQSTAGKPTAEATPTACQSTAGKSITPDKSCKQFQQLVFNSYF